MADINMSWVERLHAPRYIWSQIAALNPQHGILCREEKSQQQLLTWDVETGDTRPLTPPVDYVLNATLSPDGDFVTYLVPHPTHADVYQYVRVPFGGGDPQPIALTALMNASPHIEEANGRIGFTAVTGNGYSVQIWTPEGKKALFSYESEVLAVGPSLSFDGTIAVIATMHSAESETTYLEAYTIDTGAKISQLALPDTPLEAVKFAPFFGDSRLLVQAREGLLTRPLIWDVRTGAVNRLEGLDKESSYSVWDWIDEESVLLQYNEKLLQTLLVYNFKEQKIIDETNLLRLHPFLVYASKSSIIYHYDVVHIIPTMSFLQRQNPTRIGLPEQLKSVIYSRPMFKPYERVSAWALSPSSFSNQRAKVITVVQNDRILANTETAAWLGQDLLCFVVDLNERPFDDINLKDAIQAARQEPLSSILPMIITAHNMGAALALLALHQSDASVWAGGVVVRPILDWVHLYESVAPPEKAMMRLWFGGSPEDVPQMWRDASPLRQTTPLKVPVKILYHPYESLVPIQHIQTYAANNPMVELIDISRDMVGPAHEQQERLITRMLEAGLPLLRGTL